MNDREKTFDEVKPKYSLRPYQKKAVDEVLHTLRCHQRALLHAPTGAGKTRMAMSVVSMHLRRHAPTTVLWLAPTKELVTQAAEDFQSAWRHHGDYEAAVVQWRGGGERFTHGTQIRRNTMLVAGLQMAVQSSDLGSWIERALREQVSLVVFDEAHHSVAPTYRGLVESIVQEGQAKRFLLGLSATPGRASTEEAQALADMYHGLKIGVGGRENPVRYLQRKGYLAKAKFENHPFDGSPEPTVEGEDYSNQVLSTLGEIDPRNEKIVRIVKHLFEAGKKRAIIFTPSVHSAQVCAKTLRDDGFMSFDVSGETPQNERDRRVNTFCNAVKNNPNPHAIFNCNVLTAGFDAPEIDAVVIGKPTKSAVRLQQMVGRALRGTESGGTDEAEIHMVVDNNYEDYANLAEQFGKWDELWEPAEDT